MTTFDALPEQLEAKGLLATALTEGPAHAYLLHGPPGVGKGDLALLFAAELLGDHARVMRRTHPDLYVLEPLGDQIRIDDIRELRRDLHMRPFEASRRVYLVFGADTMNDDAADALLKDLEEPPPYAVIVLIADDIGPVSETIRSRCQAVPFRRLSERAIREAIRVRAPDLPDEEVTTLSRVAGGRLDRVARLLDPAATRRREALLGVAAVRLPRPGVRRRRGRRHAARRNRRARRRGEGARPRTRSRRSSSRAARRSSASGGPSEVRSVTSSSRSSRSSSGGIATSSYSPREPRQPSCTSTGSRS